MDKKTIIIIGASLFVIVLIIVIVLFSIDFSSKASETKEKEDATQTTTKGGSAQTTTKEETDYYLPRHKSKTELGIYSQVAVASDAKNCAPIGVKILKDGGSAIDAAIAVLLCMGVVIPESIGLGGGFFMVYYQKATGKAKFLNAREKAPLKSYENMYQTEKPDASTLGPLSIAVPGELAGYAKAYDLFSEKKITWADLFKPSIDLCTNGIEVTQHLAESLKQLSKEIKERKDWKFLINPTTNEVYKEGEKFKRLKLAETLKIMAKDGKKALYDKNEELSKKFMHDLKEIKSIITEEDLEQYEVLEAEPVAVKMANGLTVYSSAPPGSGALVGSMLNILSGFGITKDVSKSKEKSILYLHRLLETFKFTFAKRFKLEDNEATMPDFVKKVTSKEYVEEIRKKIKDDTAYPDETHYGFDKDFKEDHGTASMAVIAPNGDAVVTTTTINLFFGSLEISKSTGIILNNEMDDFSLPNVTSAFGVPPYPYNRIKPGKRPTSSMSPTIIVDDASGKVRLAIGGSGGTKITTSIAQVAIRNLFLDENIKEAVDAPRFHQQLFPNFTEYEENISKETFELLNAKKQIFGKSDRLPSIVVAVARGKDDKLYTNVDYRGGGSADGY